MTRHPAKPATYRPFTDPGPVAAELDDLAAMARDAGFTAPLRDVMATLIADWQDTTLNVTWRAPWGPRDSANLDAAYARTMTRRGLA